MKNWDYYSKPVGISYCGHKEESLFKDSLISKIDFTQLTVAERTELLVDVKRKVREYVHEQNEPFREAQRKLKAEFWEDARKELGYTEFFTDVQVKILENKAYEEGHAYGFSSIFERLKDLVGFIQIFIKKNSTLNGVALSEE